jgi:hypothetical protein
MADPKAKQSEVKAMTLDEAFKTDKSDWEYVAIPQFTVLGTEHDSISLNNYEFAAGKKHFVPKVVAEQLRDRLAADHEQKLRINSDQKRMEVIRRTRGAIDMPVEGI